MAVRADWGRGEAGVRLELMRDRALWLLVLTFPPLVLGIVVVAVLIAAQTLLVSTVLAWRSERRLRCSAPPRLTSSTSGPGWARAWPAGAGGIRDLSLRRAAAEFWSRRSARSPAIEVEQRRGEADLATVMARASLRTDDLRSSLLVASARSGQVLGLSAATIVIGATAGGEPRCGSGWRRPCGRVCTRRATARG
jgi:hypothetical protein